MKNTIKINESQLREMIANVISEAFKSPKLAQLTIDNGGIERGHRNYGVRGNSSVYKHGDYIPASELTDDMIGDEISNDNPFSNDYNNSITFNNGKSYKLQNLDNVPYVKDEHYWQETPTNQGYSNMEDLDDFPDINDEQTPYSVGPFYTKVKGKYYQNQDTGKYRSGVGDTGDHNRKELLPGSKTQQSAPYDGFSVSKRAGEAQNKRAVKKYQSSVAEAIDKITKKVLKETELDYDIDNFSGRWSRGQRYDILVDGDVYYEDVPEETVDRLYGQLVRSGWDNVQIVER